MGDAIVADVGADAARRCSRSVGEANRAEPTAAARADGRRGDRPADADDGPQHARPTSSRTTGSSCSSPPRARSRSATSCGSRSPAATTSARAAASASGSRPRSASRSPSPTGPSSASSARARPSTRSPALWTAAAYKVPVTFLVLRNAEYAILKWFADIEEVKGAPGLDLPAVDTRRDRDRLRRRLEAGLGPRRAARGALGLRSAPASPSWSRSRWRRGCTCSRHARTPELLRALRGATRSGRRGPLRTGRPTSWPTARPSRCAPSWSSCSAPTGC